MPKQNKIPNNQEDEEYENAENDHTGANNYKGMYFNDNHEQKFYQGGAHFEYTELCSILEKLVTKIPADRRAKTIYGDNESVDHPKLKDFAWLTSHMPSRNQTNNLNPAVTKNTITTHLTQSRPTFHNKANSICVNAAQNTNININMFNINDNSNNNIIINNPGLGAYNQINPNNYIKKVQPKIIKTANIYPGGERNKNASNISNNILNISKNNQSLIKNGSAEKQNFFYNVNKNNSSVQINNNEKKNINLNKSAYIVTNSNSSNITQHKRNKNEISTLSDLTTNRGDIYTNQEIDRSVSPQFYKKATNNVNINNLKVNHSASKKSSNLSFINISNLNNLQNTMKQQKLLTSVETLNKIRPASHLKSNSISLIKENILIEPAHNVKSKKSRNEKIEMLLKESSLRRSTNNTIHREDLFNNSNLKQHHPSQISSQLSQISQLSSQLSHSQSKNKNIPMEAITNKSRNADRSRNNLKNMPNTSDNINIMCNNKLLRNTMEGNKSQIKLDINMTLNLNNEKQSRNSKHAKCNSITQGTFYKDVYLSQLTNKYIYLKTKLNNAKQTGNNLKISQNGKK
jgi:hypothetical protein